MGNFLAVLRMVISLLPLLSQLVQAVEATLPASGQGAAKLEMVRKMLESAYGTMGTATVAFDQVWVAVMPIISSLVSLFKTNGTFAVQPTPAAQPSTT